jgi:transposase
MTAADQLPDDVDTLKAALLETRAKLMGATALIEHLQLVIEKMKREKLGPRSERSQPLLDQMELELEELAAAQGEDEAKTQTAGIPVRNFTRRPASRRSFPAHLPRRRIVHPAPTTCPCCGGINLSKIGEDITETLDVVPRQWFVTEHVREKFSCRSCEKISQPPAPFHAIARGFAGPSLLAMILVDNQSSAAQPAEGQICLRGDRALGLDHGRPCRRLCGDVDAALRANQSARVRRRAHPRRRHHRAGVGQDEDPHRADLDLVRDDRPFGGQVPAVVVFFYSPDRTSCIPICHLLGASQPRKYSYFVEHQLLRFLDTLRIKE